MIVSPSMSPRPNRRLYAIAIAAAVGIVAVALKFVFGAFHNFVVLAPLLGSWLVLLAFPRDRR